MPRLGVKCFGNTAHMIHVGHGLEWTCFSQAPVFTCNLSFYPIFFDLFFKFDPFIACYQRSGPTLRTFWIHFGPLELYFINFISSRHFRLDPLWRHHCRILQRRHNKVFFTTEIFHHHLSTLQRFIAFGQRPGPTLQTFWIHFWSAEAVFYQPFLCAIYRLDPGGNNIAEFSSIATKSFSRRKFVTINAATTQLIPLRFLTNFDVSSF